MYLTWLCLSRQHSNRILFVPFSRHVFPIIKGPIDGPFECSVMIHQSFPRNCPNLIHEVLVMSNYAMKFQTGDRFWYFWRRFHRHRSSVRQRGYRNSHRNRFGWESFSSELPLLQFLSALVTLSAQARNISPPGSEEETEFLDLEQNF